jgi:hypothetical protein
MIKDALEYLFSQHGRRVEPIDLGIKDATARHIALDGTISRIDVPAKPREHRPASLDDLIKCVDSFGSDPAVFFDEEAVVAVLDGEGHRVELASFILAKSDQFTTIRGLSQRGWMDQKSFIRLLRIDLAGCMEPAQLLDRVRKLSFESGQTVRSEVSRQKESLGRLITAAASGETEIPEEVDVHLSLYKSLGENEVYTIRCSVEVDPTRTDAFRLLPMPDEIESIQHAHMGDIRCRLTAGLPGIPVFYGHP